MPQTPREYAYAALMLGAAALAIGGAVVFFQGDASFPRYIGGLLLLALAALSYLCARELKPKAAKDTNPDTTAINREETTHV